MTSFCGWTTWHWSRSAPTPAAPSPAQLSALPRNQPAWRCTPSFSWPQHSATRQMQSKQFICTSVWTAVVFCVSSHSQCVSVATVKHLGFILRWGTWQLFILLSYTMECPHQPNNKSAPPDHGKFTLLCLNNVQEKKEWTFEVLTWEDMNPWNWLHVEHQK